MGPFIFYPEKLPFYPQILILLEQTFFLIHIVLINLILGWTLLFAYQQFRKEFLPETAVFFLKKSPIFFALAINMAIPALLFLQVVYGPLFYSSSILIAVHWMLIIPLVILVYYLSYLISKKISSQRPFKRFILIQFLVLLYVAFVLANNLTLMENPQTWNIYFTNKKGTYLPLDIPYLYFKYLHFLIASLAISGLSLGILGFLKNDKASFSKGLNLFFYTTLFQLGIGLAFLLTLPADIRNSFLGKVPKVAGFFYFSLVLAVFSLYFSKKANLKLTLTFLGLTLIFMVINRYHLRTLQLGTQYQTESLPVSSQTDIFLVFLMVLGLGVLMVYYLIKLAFSKPEVKER
ncbi:hypothetical protein F1847_07465 [Thermodesulfobacterium sp. TA1]|uniref:hypothetical protein n=1 Tax=Thermodesulfobacterium sp. TA1 TaxID=2234087 RepID=UPI0012326CCD|nr:hypothetical protein [Thermodesulfobacterium sp. TA1]QER42585.1 hypothetical protein F1847_07465 [Thermodesulfobacterium sp. TA1]